nr:MAG TPA: hypothetical protein [Caudoviricetes sp.]
MLCYIKLQKNKNIFLYFQKMLETIRLRLQHICQSACEALILKGL